LAAALFEAPFSAPASRISLRARVSRVVFTPLVFPDCLAGELAAGFESCDHPVLFRPPFDQEISGLPGIWRTTKMSHGKSRQLTLVGAPKSFHTIGSEGAADAAQWTRRNYDTRTDDARRR
jgi:hypothetical protein